MYSSNLSPYASIVSPSGYNLTKDPLAIFSFGLLIFTIFAFLYILIVIARRSGNDYWDSIRRQSARQRRSDELQNAEDAIPLIVPDRCAGSSDQLQAEVSAFKGLDRTKKVRFSDVLDVQSIPAAPIPFDELYDDCSRLNAKGEKTEKGKRRSMMSEQQAEDLYFS